jgi:hypothetical protein
MHISCLMHAHSCSIAVILCVFFKWIFHDTNMFSCLLLSGFFIYVSYVVSHVESHAKNVNFLFKHLGLVA